MPVRRRPLEARHQPADRERTLVEDLARHRHAEKRFALEEELDDPDRVVADVGQRALIGEGIRGRHGRELPDEESDLARDVAACVPAQAGLLPAA